MPNQLYVIDVNLFSKYYQVPTRDAGLNAAFKSLFKRSFKTVKAVDEISFKIEPGEVVGFLGPNGAGKTTTLKMLSGLLHLTSGEARVLGFEPSKRSPKFLQQITLVMGNRQQLIWDAAGRWPVGIYPDWLRYGLTFLIPVAFAVTIPAEALTGRLTPINLIGAIGLTIFFMILARVIWNLGVKHYSGASA